MSADGKEPPKVKVGSGITEYEREPVLMDGQTRHAYLRGDLVPANVRPFGGPTFPEIRSQAEAISKGVFSELGLPNPFDLHDMDGKMPPLDWETVKFQGHEFLKEKMNSGYRTVASLYWPDEDHSPLWYAANIATALASYDAVKLRVKETNANMGWEIEMAAMHGAHLGGLMANYNLKFNHEKDALRGNKNKKNLNAASGSHRRREVERLRPRHEYMEKLYERKGRKDKTNCARLTIKALGLSVKPKSLVSSFNGYLESKEKGATPH